MNCEPCDSPEEYLTHFRFHHLLEAWAEEVGRVRPADPFSYLVNLVKAYRGEDGELVTCENDWCHVALPRSQYESHLVNCATEVQFVLCPTCRLRVRETDYRLHKQGCLLRQCLYCGERVPARLVEYCPKTIRMNLEIGYRVRMDKKSAEGKVKAKSEGPDAFQYQELWDEPPLVPLPDFTRDKLNFPERSKGPLTVLQRMWRSAAVYERMMESAYRQVWDGIEFHRVSHRTSERIGHVLNRPRPHTPKRLCPLNISASADHSIGAEEFSDISESILSGAVVEFEVAVRILTNAIAIMTKRPAVLHVRIPDDGDVVTVGDLHGQLKDLALVLNELGGLPSPRRYYVFNGDYVDRGPNGVGVLLQILLLQCVFPDCIFINRGNHEDHQVNAEYGFQAEVLSKYTHWEAKRLLDLFSVSYDAMAWATILDEDVIVVHGGVPRNSTTISEIEAVGRVTKFSAMNPRTVGEQLVLELLWNDPVERYRSRKVGVNHQGESWRTSMRGIGVEYLEPVTRNFLQLNKLRLVLRSHQMVQAGFQFVHGRSSCTVFSASNYAGVSGNRGAIAVLEKGSVQPTFHTWFLRDEEVDVRDITVERLFRGLSEAPPGVIDELSADHNDTSCDKSTSAEGSITVAGGECNMECDSLWANIFCGTKNNDASVQSPIESVRYLDDTREQILARKRTLDILVRIIYNKRYSLLSSFVRADGAKNGLIYRIEWCDIMRRVLNMEIPWYFLAPRLIGASLQGGSRYVRYVPFLRSFSPCFAEMFSARFQGALLRYVFRDVDMPDEFLSCISARRLAEELPTSPSVPGFVGNRVAVDPNIVRPFSGDDTEDEQKGCSLLVDGSSAQSPDKQRGERNQGNSWRDIKLDFNSLVSALRSVSPAGAAMEDNAVFTLFEMFDKSECGHVTVGDIVDIANNATADGSDESVLLDSAGSFTTDTRTQRQNDEQPTIGSSVLHGECSARSAGVVVPTSSLTVGRRECGSHSILSASSKPQEPECFPQACSGMGGESGEEVPMYLSPEYPNQESISTMMSDAGCLRIYPVLLHLHERFACDPVQSPRRHFKVLNYTHDGRLTFGQFAVALNYIGRCMLNPPTPHDQQVIFCLVRDVGQYLLAEAESGVLRGSLEKLNNVITGMLPPKNQVTTLGTIMSSVASINTGRDYLTSQQFVAFFSTLKGSCSERQCHQGDSVGKDCGEERDGNVGVSAIFNPIELSGLGTPKSSIMDCLRQNPVAQGPRTGATTTRGTEVPAPANHSYTQPAVQTSKRADGLSLEERAEQCRSSPIESLRPPKEDQISTSVAGQASSPPLPRLSCLPRLPPDASLPRWCRDRLMGAESDCEGDTLRSSGTGRMSGSVLRLCSSSLANSQRSGMAAANGPGSMEGDVLSTGPVLPPLATVKGEVSVNSCRFSLSSTTLGSEDDCPG